jgi:Cu/Ag efflux protein CusF
MFAVKPAIEPQLVLAEIHQPQESAHQATLPLHVTTAVNPVTSQELAQNQARDLTELVVQTESPLANALNATVPVTGLEIAPKVVTIEEEEIDEVEMIEEVVTEEEALQELVSLAAKLVTELPNAVRKVIDPEDLDLHLVVTGTETVIIVDNQDI